MSMNLEAFLNIWDSDEEITYHPSLFEWMKETQKNPLLFWKEVLPSFPLESYDFYQEAILKHLDSDSVAIKLLKEQGEDSWTYKKLHQAVNQQLPFWENVGDQVALVLPFGIEYIVALLTAIRLKKSFIVLPLNDSFLGKELLFNHLSRWNPSDIITLNSFKETLEEFETPLHFLSISFPFEEEDNLEASAYSSGDPFIWGLDAAPFFLSYFRDAFLTLRLKKGSSWAQPLTAPSLIEPAMTLTTFFAGATLVYLSDNLLLSHPQRLVKEEISTLGVSTDLQRLWTTSPGAPFSAKLWHKSPFASNPYDWMTFMEQNKLTKVRQADLYFSPSEGGITLLSKPKKYRGQSFLMPGLGVSWELKGTRDDWGAFMMANNLPSLPKLTLAQIGNEWTIYGSSLPIYKEAFYPVDEIEEMLNDLTFVLASFVHSEKHPKDLLSRAITLFIFHPPDQKEEDLWKEAIEKELTQRVGKAFLPHRILFFPFYPRMDEQGVHRGWAIGQYESGLLQKKKESAVVQHLNRLRHTLIQQEGAQ